MAGFFLYIKNAAPKWVRRIVMKVNYSALNSSVQKEPDLPK